MFHGEYCPLKKIALFLKPKLNQVFYISFYNSGNPCILPSRETASHNIIPMTCLVCSKWSSEGLTRYEHQEEMSPSPGKQYMAYEEGVK